LGWFSWRYVERPFRNRGFMTRRQIFAATVSGLTVVGAAGLVFVGTDGAIDRYPRHLRAMMSVSAQERGNYVREHYDAEARDHRFVTQRPKLLLIGDSFSQDFYNMIRENGAFTGYEISADMIAARCQFHLDGDVPEGAIAPGDAARCSTDDNHVNEFTVQRAREADIVILAFLWRDWAVRQLPRTLDALGLRIGTEVILVGRKYFPTPDMAQLQTMTADELVAYRAPLEDETRRVNAMLAEAAINAQFVDPTALVCDTLDACRAFTPNGELISHDRRNLTREGARFLGRLLFEPGGPLARFGHVGPSEE